MSRMYFATVIAVFVTTSLATNLLVAGTHGSVRPGAIARLHCRLRRLGRWLKRAIDTCVASMLARRERQTVVCAQHHLSDRELRDIGLCRNGHVARPDGGRADPPVSPLEGGRPR